MRGDLLEALFYAPEDKSPSSRAHSMGFCALRPGAECTTPVDQVLCARDPSALRQWTECAAPVDRVRYTSGPSALRQGAGGAALEFGDLCYRTVACARVG